jgi:hypothetical protein
MFSCLLCTLIGQPRWKFRKKLQKSYHPRPIPGIGGDFGVAPRHSETSRAVLHGFSHPRLTIPAKFSNVARNTRKRLTSSFYGCQN